MVRKWPLKNNGQYIAINQIKDRTLNIRDWTVCCHYNGQKVAIILNGQKVSFTL
jgi:hypothetical protein